MKKIAVLALIAFLSGCASTSSKDDAVTSASSPETKNMVAQNEEAVPGKKKMRCKRVKPVGSHRTQLVCSDPNQSAAEARRTRDSLNRNNTRNSGCIGCGGDG